LKKLSTLFPSHFQPEADPPLAEWAAAREGGFSIHHPHLASPIKGEGLKKKNISKKPFFVVSLSSLS